MEIKEEVETEETEEDNPEITRKKTPENPNANMTIKEISDKNNCLSCKDNKK